MPLVFIITVRSQKFLLGYLRCPRCLQRSIDFRSAVRCAGVRRPAAYHQLQSPLPYIGYLDFPSTHCQILGSRVHRAKLLSLFFLLYYKLCLLCFCIFLDLTPVAAAQCGSWTPSLDKHIVWFPLSAQPPWTCPPETPDSALPQHFKYL